MENKHSVMDRVINVVGKKADIARATGVSHQAVCKWFATGKVPAKHCIIIEAATNGAVTRYDLRPDIFGIHLRSERLVCDD